MIAKINDEAVIAGENFKNFIYDKIVVKHAVVVIRDDIFLLGSKFCLYIRRAKLAKSLGIAQAVIHMAADEMDHVEISLALPRFRLIYEWKQHSVRLDADGFIKIAL